MNTTSAAIPIRSLTDHEQPSRRPDPPGSRLYLPPPPRPAYTQSTPVPKTAHDPPAVVSRTSKPPPPVSAPDSPEQSSPFAWLSISSINNVFSPATAALEQATQSFAAYTSSVYQATIAPAANATSALFTSILPIDAEAQENTATVSPVVVADSPAPLQQNEPPPVPKQKDTSTIITNQVKAPDFLISESPNCPVVLVETQSSNNKWSPEQTFPTRYLPSAPSDGTLNGAIRTVTAPPPPPQPPPTSPSRSMHQLMSLLSLLLFLCSLTAGRHAHHRPRMPKIPSTIPEKKIPLPLPPWPHSHRAHNTKPTTTSTNNHVAHSVHQRSLADEANITLPPHTKSAFSLLVPTLPPKEHSATCFLPSHFCSTINADAPTRAISSQAPNEPQLPPSAIQAIPCHPYSQAPVYTPPRSSITTLFLACQTCISVPVHICTVLLSKSSSTYTTPLILQVQLSKSSFRMPPSF